MRLDALLAFVPVGTPLSCVGSTGATFYSNVVDLLGVGVGQASPNIMGNVSNNAYGAADGMGVGQERVEMAVATGTAFATSNSATLNIQLQAAVDSGTSGGYQPGTWNVIEESGTISATNLAANTVVFRFPWLPPFPENLRPRFLRLAFVTPASTNFTTGTIAYAVPSLGRDDWFAAYAAKNYTVA